MGQQPDPKAPAHRGARRTELKDRDQPACLGAPTRRPGESKEGDRSLGAKACGGVVVDVEKWIDI
jgi:hypothetical protein